MDEMDRLYGEERELYYRYHKIRDELRRAQVACLLKQMFAMKQALDALCDNPAMVEHEHSTWLKAIREHRAHLMSILQPEIDRLERISTAR